MIQIVRNALSFLYDVFGRRGNAEEAWIDLDSALTPREGLVRRMAAILQWGSLIGFLLLIVLLLLLATGTLLPDALAGWLVAGTEATGGVRALVGLAGIAANISLLLMLSTAVSAQEFWAIPVAVLVFLGNAALLFTVQFYPALLALVTLLIIFILGARDPGALHANAVTVKELRGRMRGARSFAIITVFLLLMGSFTVLLYMLQLPRLSTQDTIITGELGRLLFLAVVGIELLLIVFIVPALTAGAITGERERKTYDLLQTTLLSAPAFIVGKMESALGYMLLLLLSAIPLQSIAFLFGGVSGTEVMVALVLLSVTALVLGALGMFFSAMTERTMTATVRVYTAAVVLVFGLPMVAFLLFGGAFQNAIAGIRVPAASAAQEALYIYGDMIVSSLNPVTSAFYTQQMLIDQQQIALMDVQLATDGSFIPVISPWILTSIIYLGVTAILLMLAVRQMRRNA
jgi:hypothetical protein